ncbi:MAG: hydroxymethylbilane synthase, partial [Deltaproteobacteria bacterium]|nr:hydroxymethylbilane synthase [Deltaproteobacteria bacterium]
MKKNLLMIGSRASALAVAQTEQCMAQWQHLHADLVFEHKTFTTTGDRLLDRSLSQEGGKGLFIKELEEALLQKKIDVAIHSLKDVPSELPEGF